jgi:hypothetical protein
MFNGAWKWTPINPGFTIKFTYFTDNKKAPTQEYLICLRLECSLFELWWMSKTFREVATLQSSGD